MGSGYVHGCSAREQRRLRGQARTLTEPLHADSRFPEGSAVLEAGCGVGSQTVTLAARNPTCRYRTAEADGAFCYTFFKAFATWGR
jgi:tRNA G46 methylase TrmB